ncbi:MAG: hypothetical protein U1F11_12985 [Steroidobacteraceae bacterium]
MPPASTLLRHLIGVKLAFIGRERITVTAGSFDALHFRFTETTDDGSETRNEPGKHPPHDLWCTADGNYTFLLAYVTGYMMTRYELDGVRADPGTRVKRSLCAGRAGLAVPGLVQWLASAPDAAAEVAIRRSSTGEPQTLDPQRWVYGQDGNIAQDLFQGLDDASGRRARSPWGRPSPGAPRLDGRRYIVSGCAAPGPTVHRSRAPTSTCSGATSIRRPRCPRPRCCTRSAMPAR